MKYKLIYSKDRNVSDPADRTLNIHFSAIFEVLKKIESLQELYLQKQYKHVLIVSHLIFNIAKILIKV